MACKPVKAVVSEVFAVAVLIDEFRSLGTGVDTEIRHREMARDT